MTVKGWNNLINIFVIFHPLTVISLLEKGAYLEKKSVFHCHIKLVLLLIFYVFESCFRQLAAILVSDYLKKNFFMGTHDSVYVRVQNSA